MIKTSFGVFAFTDNEFTIDFYRAVFTDVKFWKSLIYTLYLGFIPTIISVVIGTSLAILSYMVYKEDRNMFVFAKFPNMISYIIYTFAVILLVMQTGLLCRILCYIGVIDDPNDFPLFIYDKYGIGIMLIYTMKQVPFVFFIVHGSLVKVGRKYIDLSYSLGANAMRTIITVVLPTIKTSILSVFLLCFAFNFGSYEVPLIVGSPKYETMSIISQKYYTSTDLTQRPLSMVINVFILILCFSMLVWYVNYSNRGSNDESF